MFERFFGAALAIGNIVLLESTAPEFAVLTVLVLALSALAWPVAELIEAALE